MTRFPLLGDRLKTRRTSLRMTRKQLGAQAGVGEKSIVNYEAGERNPSPGVLLNLANALGVSTAWLSGEVIDPDAPGPQAPPPRPNLFTLMASIVALPPEDRAALLRLLQSEAQPAG